MNQRAVNWISLCLMAFLGTSIMTPVVHGYLLGKAAPTVNSIAFSVLLSVGVLGFACAGGILASEMYDNPYTWAFLVGIGVLILSPAALTRYVLGFHYVAAAVVLIVTAVLVVYVYVNYPFIRWCMRQMNVLDYRQEKEREHRQSEKLFKKVQRRQQARLT